MLLVVGFFLTTMVEARGLAAGGRICRRGYMGLRWVLSAVVVICLVTVWLVLMLHGRIVLW